MVAGDSTIVAAEVLAAAEIDLAVGAAEEAVLAGAVAAAVIATGIVVTEEVENYLLRNMRRRPVMMSVRPSRYPKVTRRLFCRASRLRSTVNVLP